MPIDDDYDDQDDEQQHDEQMAQLSVKDLKALRKKARMADELSPKQQAYERELGFLKAGINTEDAKMKYFVKAYDGDLTAEAIKAAAIEAGLVEPPRDQVSQDELQQHDRLASASAGADGISNEPDLRTKMANAKNPDEIMRLVTEAGVPTTWNRP